MSQSMERMRSGHSSGGEGRIPVGVVGSGYWPEVVGELLRRAGIRNEVVDISKRRYRLYWVLSGAWRRYDVIHMVGGFDWRLGTVLEFCGAAVVVHWIGSDVLRLRSPRKFEWDRRFRRRFAQRSPRAHLADSPLLVEELREIGIKASVVRLLPRWIEAAVEPLPSKPAVLSYWFDGRARYAIKKETRRDFYGGDIVLQLAREFPDIEFRILQATGKDERATRNVTFLGHQNDPTPYYRDTSAVIRIPKHDSISAIVLEMLARGRYAIYNTPLEGCHFASNLDEARTALADILTKAEPNKVGAEMVKRDFSLQAEAQALKEFYSRFRP